MTTAAAAGRNQGEKRNTYTLEENPLRQVKYQSHIKQINVRLNSTENLEDLDSNHGYFFHNVFTFSLSLSFLFCSYLSLLFSFIIHQVSIVWLC